MNWFKDSYKNLFFDFHTHSSASGVAEDFDADAWMGEVEKLGAEAVSVFAVDAFGWRFYRKGEHGWVHPRLPEGLDLLGELTRAAKARGIKTIAYFNTVESEAVALHRPEFRELDSDRVPKSDYEIYEGMVICWLGRSFQEIFLPQVRDIAANYEIDALFFDGTYAHGPCYCVDCTTNFKQDTGHDLPLGEDDEVWMTWVIWAEARYERIRNALVDTVKEARPAAAVCFNWYAATRRPAIVTRPDDLFFNLDLHPQAQLTDASFQARAWNVSGVPFTCQNTLFLDWWGDWGIKPMVALQQECAAVLANGGRIFTGFQLLPDHSLLPDARDALAEMMKFVDSRVGAVAGTNPVADIAVLHPSTSYAAKKPVIFDDRALADEQPVGRYQLGLPEVFPDESAVRGAHRVLFELGYDYQVVTEDILERNMDSYRLIVLPGMRHVSAEFTERLRAWVQAGGSLLVTDEPTLWAEEQLTPFLELLGVSRKAFYDHDHAYVEQAGSRPFLVRSRFALAEASSGAEEEAGLTAIYLREDGRPLLKASPPGAPTGYSAVVTQELGEGRTAYFGFEAFSAYLKTNQWRLTNVLCSVLDSMLPTPRVRLGGGKDVEVSLRSRGAELIVHLVNHTGYASREWGAWATSTEVVPRTGLSVRLQLPKDPTEVRDGESGEELSWQREGDAIKVDLPPLGVHSWITVRA